MSLSFLLEKQHNVNDFISLWGEELPLLCQLKNTIQDNEWHAEGDVHIHTDMVLEEVYKIINNNIYSLTENDKISLILAAIFHDICKPLTTKEKEINGKIRIVSPKHEEFGRSYLFFKLNDIVKNHDIFNNVINLVGYHQIPKLLVVKDAHNGKYYQLARKVSPKLIYLLELADMRGRTCNDKNEQIEYLDIFKLFMEELNLFDNDIYSAERRFIYNELTGYSERTKEFVFNEFCRQFENGNIFTPEEEIARSYQYRDNFSHLVLTCGISGIGKSTYLKEHFSDYNLISLDLIREELSGSRSNHSQERKVLDLAKQKLKSHLAKKENVVWDATNYRHDFRKVPTQLGFNYNAFNEILLFNKTKKEILSQNNNRQHVVPKEAIERQIQKFEVPDIQETHTIKNIYDF